MPVFDYYSGVYRGGMLPGGGMRVSPPYRGQPQGTASGIDLPAPMGDATQIPNPNTGIDYSNSISGGYQPGADLSGTNAFNQRYFQFLADPNSPDNIGQNAIGQNIPLGDLDAPLTPENHWFLSNWFNRTLHMPTSQRPDAREPKASAPPPLSIFNAPQVSTQGSYGVAGQGGSYFTTAGGAGSFNQSNEGRNDFGGYFPQQHALGPMGKELYHGLMKGSGWSQLLYPKTGAPTYKDYVANYNNAAPVVNPIPIGPTASVDRGDQSAGWGLKHTGQNPQSK